MAVSSCRNARFRYSMTLGSPFMCAPMLITDGPETTGLVRTILEYEIGFSQHQWPAYTVRNCGSSGGLAVGAARAGDRGCGAVQRLIHDPADGPGTAAA